ncbi:MAG TPA: dienelactone hydrolase family protein [Nocardioides sp.]|nr:dienelactone hydrolase family protein [Nocardioides sp.]
MGAYIEIETGDWSAEAYLAGDDGAPGVLLFIDGIGLRPQIADMAERIASWGYVVLAPNVFHREGAMEDLQPTVDLRDPGVRSSWFTDGPMKWIGRLGAEASDSDTDVWLSRLADHARPGAVGVVGYCMGVRLAVRAAARHPDTVAAVGGFHGGRLVVDAPDSPHRLLAQSRAEFLFAHADKDRSMTADKVALLGEALVQAGLRHTNEIYPGAAHGYTMADTSTYDEGAAERHYTALRALLDRTL